MRRNGEGQRGLDFDLALAIREFHLEFTCVAPVKNIEAAQHPRGCLARHERAPGVPRLVEHDLEPNFEIVAVEWTRVPDQNASRVGSATKMQPIAAPLGGGALGRAFDHAVVL